MQMISTPSVESAARVAAEAGWRAKYEDLARRRAVVAQQFEDRLKKEYILGFTEKSIADFAPGGGTLVEELVDKEYKEVEARRDAALKTLLRQGLEELRLAGSFDELDLDTPKRRFERVQEALYRSRYILKPGGLFDSVGTQVEKDELQNEAILYLGTAIEQLQRDVEQHKRDHPNGYSAKDFGTDERQMGAASSAVDATRNVKEKAKTLEIKAGDEGVAEDQNEQAIEFGDFAKGSVRQLDAAAGIMAELGYSDAARDISILSSGISLSANIAVAYANPAEALPTLLQGIKFFKALGGEQENDGMARAVGQMLELQKKILAQLRELDEKITQYHEREMAAIAAVNANVALIYDVIRADLRSDLDICFSIVKREAFNDQFAKKLPGYPRFKDSRITFGSYQELVDQNADTSAIRNCKSAFEKYFRPIDAKIPELFHLPSNVAINDAAQAPAAEAVKFAPSVDYNTRAYKVLKTYYVAGALHSLSNPALFAAAISQPDKTAGLELEEIYDDNVASALDPYAVTKYVAYLVSSHVYFELLSDGDQKIPTLEQLYARKRLSSSTEERLRFAVHMSEVAIAQRAMLAGDVLLPAAYQVWQLGSDFDSIFCKKWEGKRLFRDHACTRGGQPVDRDAARKEFQELKKELLGSGDGNYKGLLQSSPYFASNLAAYIVERRLALFGHSKLAYSVGVSARKSPALLRKLLGSDVAFQHLTEEKDVGSGWAIDINGAQVSLPQMSDILGDELWLTPTPYLTDLLRVRQAAASELGAYQTVAPSNLTSSDLQDLKVLLAAGIDPYQEILVGSGD
ncbi:hypothetical protein [Mesorhizobium wenxiniae]|uniref:Uncharacterized protein n=1 Tax=Mesorhizobium wenxiniae TaxID=2014805 RepID=A0A271KLR7_9HYPH|nr:hypothetical protein [Mesorhizobium wenxiniae]PAP96636.1 hypothetical protein CIT31_02585 [Mesorhizobium wenxiniae]